MNYYKQIAEMLGLELGQEFRIIDSHERTIDAALFEITEDGLFSKANNLSGKVTLMLDLILRGKCKAVPKQWKPKNGEQYWYYDSKNGAECSYWHGFNYDYYSWKTGNCFRTEEETKTKGKEIMEELLKEYEEE